MFISLSLSPSAPLSPLVPLRPHLPNTFRSNTMIGYSSTTKINQFVAETTKTRLPALLRGHISKVRPRPRPPLRL